MRRELKKGSETVLDSGTAGEAVEFTMFVDIT